jgi:alpha-galactosidase
VGRAALAGLLLALLVLTVPPPIPQAATTVPVPANHLAARPPMGWNSWNAWGCAVTEAHVREAADRLVATGMRELGYRLVAIDDCWMAPDRAADGTLRADPVRFPSGIPALAGYVHRLGLQLGIYASPGLRTCQNLPGSWQHESQDAATFAAWGVDYLKYDYCSVDARVQYPGLSEPDRALLLFAAMGNALAAAGRPIVYSLSDCCARANLPGWAAQVANLWRAATDITPSWAAVLANLDQSAGAATGPGGWRDPDMLEVGNAGLSDTEARAHFSLWALLNAPLLAGNDLATMAPSARAVLTNPAVIAVDQDWSGSAARLVSGAGAAGQVWDKPMSDGSVAVVLLNRGAAPAVVGASAGALGLPAGGHRVTDLWTGRSTASVTGAVGATVGPHDVLMLRMSGAAG